MAAHETGHALLLTLMDVVDDTVLVNKSIFGEFQEHLFPLATNKFGRIPLLYPFVGRKNRLIPPPVIAQIEEIDQIRAATRYISNHSLNPPFPPFLPPRRPACCSGYAGPITNMWWKKQQKGPRSAPVGAAYTPITGSTARRRRTCGGSGAGFIWMPVHCGSPFRRRWYDFTHPTQTHPNPRVYPPCLHAL